MPTGSHLRDTDRRGLASAVAFAPDRPNPEPQSLQIVGGGLAGLALGIRLRRRSIPVTVWERGRYPRHRVCGEVLSGAGPAILERFGLLDAALSAGARWARTAVFYLGRKNAPVRELPEPALCVSRYCLDNLLANQFRELGGNLREGERWREAFAVPGTIRAGGRQATGVESGWRWFGTKAHFHGVQLAADIEMHLLPDGYVGLCRLGGGEVNVCGLFRRRAHALERAGEPLAWLRGPAGTTLHARLSDGVVLEGSLCSVAGLPLRPRRRRHPGECRLGDALGMISPFTGNGMSIALESAELAAGPLAAFAQGALNWSDACVEVQRRCARRFACRLGLAWWLHRALLSPAARQVLRAGAQSQAVWEFLFRLTR